MEREKLNSFLESQTNFPLEAKRSKRNLREDSLPFLSQIYHKLSPNTS
jgi:hypothetical protein